MKAPIKSQRRGRAGLPRERERGSLMIELFVAMALLMVAIVPLAYSISNERHMARNYYQRAVAMEIVDGEMEVLAAGEWRRFPAGSQEYTVHETAATNLPPGRFLLTVQTNTVRLEWQPDKDQGGGVVREVKLP